jgi:hypothetical protein
MRRWISIILPFIGLAMFAFIVARTGPASIATVFRSIDLPGLAIAPLLMGAIVLIRGLRWRALMSRIGIDYPLLRACEVWTIGFFASAVTPAKVGDVVRALYVKDETNASFGEAILTVFIDRLWDLMTVLVAGMITVLVFSHYYIRVPSLWILLAGAGALIALIYMMLSKGLVRRVMRPLFSLVVPDRYKDQFSLSFHSFYDSLHAYGRGAGQNAVVAGLTLVNWMLVFALAFYVTRLLHIDVALAYVVLIMPIVTLVELIPVSVSGLGTRDATVIYFFSLVGVTSAQSVGFSIAYVLIGTYLVALLGFVFWLRNPIGLGRGQ